MFSFQVSACSEKIIGVPKENILIFSWKILAIDCQNVSLIQDRKKELKYLCKKINILLLKNLSHKRDKNVLFSSLVKSFPLPPGYLYQVTGTSCILFLLFLGCSRASLPNAAVSLEMLTPASLTSVHRSWSPSVQHEPGKALGAADLEQCSVILSAEQSSHQHWMLYKAVFTSVSTWKVSYTTLFAEFKDKRNH